MTPASAGGAPAIGKPNPGGGMENCGGKIPAAPGGGINEAGGIMGGAKPGGMPGVAGGKPGTAGDEMPSFDACKNNTICLLTLK